MVLFFASSKNATGVPVVIHTRTHTNTNTNGNGCAAFDRAPSYREYLLRIELEKQTKYTYIYKHTHYDYCETIALMVRIWSVEDSTRQNLNAHPLNVLSFC